MTSINMTDTSMTPYPLSHEEKNTKAQWLYFSFFLYLIFPLLNFFTQESLPQLSRELLVSSYFSGYIWFGILYYWAYVRERTFILLWLTISFTLSVPLAAAPLMTEEPVNYYLVSLATLVCLFGVYINYKMYRQNKRIQAYNKAHNVPDHGKYGVKTTLALLVLMILPLFAVVTRDVLRKVDETNHVRLQNKEAEMNNFFQIPSEK